MRIRRVGRGAVAALLIAAAAIGCAGRKGIVRAPETILKELRWPVAGPVSSGYGGRSGRTHHGIDILAPEGQDVRAAGEGRVLYAGGMRGYGNTVVMDHGAAISTVYGHLKAIRVQSGDIVTAETVIGTVGRTGNATTPHLHFELRVRDVPVDPAGYLRGTDGTP